MHQKVFGETKRVPKLIVPTVPKMELLTAIHFQKNFR